jgi:hypothetical protein
MRAIVWILLLLTACSSPPPPHAFDALIGQTGVVTLTNLHPDEPRSRLFSINYQQAGLIPVCSAVTLLERNQKRLAFRVESTGKRYEYYYHKVIYEPFGDHLTRYFGTACPRATLDKLPEVDRRGIKKGQALIGMSKQGVVFAMGYPPSHVTPTLEADRWTYWTNRFNKVAILFDETGRVSAVQN